VEPERAAAGRPFQVSDTHKPLHWRARCIQTTLTSAGDKYKHLAEIYGRTSTSSPVKRVFVDTGAFFAVLVPEDLHHERARVIFTRAARSDGKLVTTNMVVIETYALCSTEHMRATECSRFSRRDRARRYQIERVKESDEAAAIELVRSHEDKTYSLCDA